MTIPKRETNSAFNQRLGKLIWDTRIQSGMSRMELARFAEVTHQQLSKYEKGDNRISAEKLHLIAKALNKPITDLYNEEPAHYDRKNNRLMIDMVRKIHAMRPEKKEIIMDIVMVMEEGRGV